MRSRATHPAVAAVTRRGRPERVEWFRDLLAVRRVRRPDRGRAAPAGRDLARHRQQPWVAPRIWRPRWRRGATSSALLAHPGNTRGRRPRPHPANLAKPAAPRPPRDRGRALRHRDRRAARTRRGRRDRSLARRYTALAVAGGRPDALPPRDAGTVGRQPFSVVADPARPRRSSSSLPRRRG